MGWSCQPWTMFMPNTWWRCSSIPGPETAFPWMLRMGMGVHQWLDCMVLWNHIPLRESLPCSPGWWQRTGRRNWCASATACFGTMWCKITLQSTITFACTCICPCSTINGCFHIEHGCNDTWLHVGREHNIPSAHTAVPPSRKSKKSRKWVTHRMLVAFGIWAQCVSKICFVDVFPGCAVLL